MCDSQLCNKQYEYKCRVCNKKYCYNHYRQEHKSRCMYCKNPNCCFISREEKTISICSDCL